MTSTRPTPEYFGHTIFCDDIRHEINGKLIFVGAYTTALIVPSFPVILPRFSFWVNFAQRKDVLREEGVRIKIFLPGDENEKSSIEGELPFDPRAQAATAPFQEAIDSILVPSEPVFYQMSGEFSFAQLSLKQPGIIRVRAVRGDELIRLGALPVIQTPSLVTSAPPQN